MKWANACGDVSVLVLLASFVSLYILSAPLVGIILLVAAFVLGAIGWLGECYSVRALRSEFERFKQAVKKQREERRNE